MAVWCDTRFRVKEGRLTLCLGYLRGGLILSSVWIVYEDSLRFIFQTVFGTILIYSLESISETSKTVK